MISKSEIKAIPFRTPDIEPTDKAVVFTAALVNGCAVIDGVNMDGKKVRGVFSPDGERLVYRPEGKRFTTGDFGNMVYRTFGWYRVECEIMDGSMEVLAAFADRHKIKTYADTFDRVSGVIGCYDDFVNGIKAGEKIRKYKSGIDNVMKKVRKIPKSFDKTIYGTAGKSYMFFNRKEHNAYCMECSSVIGIKTLGRFREKDEIKCPVCREKVRLMGTGRKDRVRTERMAVLLQAYGKGVLIARYFDVSCTFRELKPEIESREVYRSMIDFTGNKVTDYEWYTYFKTGETRWCLPQKTMFNPDGLHYHFKEGALHRNGLTRELRLAGVEKILDYHNVSAMLKNHARDYNVYSRYVRIIELMAENPVIEKIYKVGLNNLFLDYYTGNRDIHRLDINMEETRLHKAVGLTKKKLRECIEMDVNANDLCIIQKTLKAGADAGRSVRRMLEVDSYSPGNVMLQMLPDARIDKIVRYLRLQDTGGSLNNLLRDYMDYHADCIELGYNMKSGMVLYPYNFKEAHDNAAAELMYRVNKEKCKKIDEWLPVLHKKYDYDKDDSYFITAPLCGEDIIREGQDMNHCVGGYIGRVADKQTIILFMRKKDKPDKPFVTMEVSPGNSVVQVRGFGNSRPEKDVWQFVDRYRQAVLQC